MNNRAGQKARREEEIAFVVIEKILGVQIELADAGAGNKMPDGRWRGSQGIAVVEVTSPPSEEAMRAYASAVKTGEAYSEAGTQPAFVNHLGSFISQLLSAPWARDNVEKLQAVAAYERHLFLFARTVGQQEYFNRLSDRSDVWSEHIDDIELPDGLTDVWFEGRARQLADGTQDTIVCVARFNMTLGWSVHEVHVDERTLPPPSIGRVRLPDGYRQPPPSRLPRP